MRIEPHKYNPGDYWMVCDECGLKFRKSQMVKRWDGCWVCQKDYEPRHPQESVRAKADKVAVPVARPDQFSEGTPMSADTHLTSDTQLDTGSYITTPVTQDDL